MTIILFHLGRHNAADLNVGKGYNHVISLDYIQYNLDKSVRRVYLQYPMFEFLYLLNVSTLFLNAYSLAVMSRNQSILKKRSPTIVSIIAKENNALLGDSLYFKFHASI